MNCASLILPSASKTRLSQTTLPDPTSLLPAYPTHQHEMTLFRLTVEHGSDVHGDRGQVDRRSSHEQCWRAIYSAPATIANAVNSRLVTSRQEHDSIKRVAIKHLYQTQVRQVPIQTGRGPLASLLDRVAGELKGRTPVGDDSISDSLGQLHVVRIAW